jgi:hypothetical protein
MSDRTDRVEEARQRNEAEAEARAEGGPPAWTRRRCPSPTP